MSNLKLVFFSALMSLLVFVILIAVACTSYPTVNKLPGLSSLLVFSSELNNKVHIYTINTDGTNLQAISNDDQTNEGIPTWSPDGTRIFFSSGQSGDYEIWSMNADGTDRKQLISRLGVDTLPRESSDGTMIVFNSIYREITCEEDRPTVEIMVAKSDGSNLKRLTTSSKLGNGWNVAPTWSPDGSKILFATNREATGLAPVLYKMNADGSDQARFGFLFPISGSEPDWSPVTNKIVFIRGDANKGEIWVMDADSPFPGLTAKKITDNPSNNRSPVWSPDGNQIAFVSDIYGNSNIFIMNADGSDVRRVTSGKSDDNHPSWR